MYFRVLTLFMTAPAVLSQSFTAEYLSTWFSHIGTTPNNTHFILDGSVDTCTTFTVDDNSTSARSTQFRIEEHSASWQQKNITLIGTNLGCEQSLHLSSLSTADTQKWTGRWNKCLLMETSTIQNLESCFYQCTCWQNCSAIQVLKAPRSLADSVWTLCHISLVVRDCKEVPKGQSGIYYMPSITSEANDPTFTRIVCDMTTDGGGWMVVVRRMDGSVNFSRNWEDYKQGFGSLEGEFWAGNELVHLLTTDGRNYSMRVDMEAYDGDKIYIIYDTFWIGPESDGYRLHVSGYSDNSTACDSLAARHDGMKFTTFDIDNDLRVDGNCADERNGWWHNDCFTCSLTAPYGEYPIVEEYRGIQWRDTWSGYKFAKYAKMMIRPD